MSFYYRDLFLAKVKGNLKLLSINSNKKKKKQKQKQKDQKKNYKNSKTKAT
jgi:hypothetical protein